MKSSTRGIRGFIRYTTEQERYDESTFSRNLKI